MYKLICIHHLAHYIFSFQVAVDTSVKQDENDIEFDATCAVH